MTLKLSGDIIISACPTCKGKGWIRQPPTFGYEGGVNNDKWQPSTGHKIPCPECKGKKVK